MLLRMAASWVACLFVMLDGQQVVVDSGRDDEEVKVLFHVCTLWAHGREPCVTQKPILKSHKFSIDS